MHELFLHRCIDRDTHLHDVDSDVRGISTTVSAAIVHFIDVDKNDIYLCSLMPSYIYVSHMENVYSR